MNKEQFPKKESIPPFEVLKLDKDTTFDEVSKEIKKRGLRLATKAEVVAFKKLYEKAIRDVKEREDQQKEDYLVFEGGGWKLKSGSELGEWQSHYDTKRQRPPSAELDK